jgi:signal transduction histidine kinase
MKTPADWLQSGSKYFSSSISNKIILPYALLTLLLAVLGVFVITRLVAGSFEARLKNQLLEAGRVVGDEIVNRERIRLETERSVANTIGVPEALVDRDLRRLNELISPIIANAKNIDSIVIVDAQGKEVLRLQRGIGPHAQVQTLVGGGADFFQWSAVSRVLADSRGVKEVQVARDPGSNELIIYTVGPIQHAQGIIGAALVGTYLSREVEVLHNIALTDLTLFDDQGRVIVSTLVRDPVEAEQVFRVFTPERYDQVISTGNVTLLDEVEGPDQEETNDITARGQVYRLAYAPFILRGRVHGVYAVALPTTFVTHTNNQSRDVLSIIFSIGVVTVFGVGYLISRRIIKPIVHLVQTSQAITHGDLEQRTGLYREDEIGILASAFDEMTGELQRLLKIQEEEASKLNAILSSIADGVIVQDMNGDMISINPAAQHILVELEQNYAYLQLHNEPEGKIAARSSPALPLLDRLQKLEFHKSERFDVGTKVLSGLSGPVFNSNGEQLGSVVVLRDITREVESEKLKDDFITSVSHELRTPLTAIKGYNELLKLTAAGKLDMRQLEFIETIGENVDDLLNLIQEMLDLSQIDAGTLGIDQEPVDLIELAEQEVQKWLPQMEEKELAFHTHLPVEPIWVEGDQAKLTRVLTNLIRNARDYTLPGGRVEVWIRKDGDRVQVDVRDTGVGISEEHQRFLFTRFFRAIHEESTYEISGAGLGLYISKAIIQAHNGEIWVESKRNQGSTFSFTLPLMLQTGNGGNRTREESLDYVKTRR